MNLQQHCERDSGPNGRDAFVGPWNHDSYKGEYPGQEFSAMDVRMHRKAIGACSVITASASMKHTFRRAWTHIREDATDVIVLCLVKGGYLRLEHTGGECIARAGHLIVMRSNQPFYLECGVEADGGYEASHLIVPAHRMRHHLAGDVSSGLCVGVAAHTFEISERIIGHLLNSQGAVNDPAVDILLETVLALAADSIRSDGRRIPSRPSLPELRFRDVLRYIDLHISDPMLSAKTVADECGVSLRYMYALFSQQGITYAALVWKKRIELAARWLSTSHSDGTSISEIAYRTGFKSASHFARMFKRELKTSPGRYRSRSTSAAEDTFELLSVEGSALRH